MTYLSARKYTDNILKLYIQLQKKCSCSWLNFGDKDKHRKRSLTTVGSGTYLVY